MSRLPHILTDLRTVYSSEAPELREELARALDGIAALLEDHGLHRQGHIPTAERYLRHAAVLASMAAAIRPARRSPLP